ncbi:MAG: hypothetical protein NVSMB9_22370 [Isosphaeraceae bacterium]
MPFLPDVVGLVVPTEREEHVRVRVTPADTVDEVVRIGPKLEGGQGSE